MRIWVIGETGQLARAIKRERPGVICFDRDRLDLSESPEVIEQALTSAQIQLSAPAAVIIAAAYTNVDGAQDNPDLAENINARAPGAVAQWCAAQDIPLIHISTDYVFAGDASAPYRPNETPAPVNAYGRSKLSGEQAVLKSGCAGAIIRTAWLYDTTGTNFLTAMIAQDAAGNPLRVVDDQIGRPTYAPDLARAVLTATDALIAAPKPCKVYHVTGSGEPVSWAGFARAILPAARVTGMSSSEFKRPAARPVYSVLDISDFETDFNTALPAWPDALGCALKDLNPDAV